jgi:hypothetical protein
MQITGQPMDMSAGPPLFQACPKDVRPPERMQDDREGDGEAGETGPAAPEVLPVAERRKLLLVGQLLPTARTSR